MAMESLPNNGTAVRDLRLFIRETDLPNTRAQGAMSTVVGLAMSLLFHADAELQSAVHVLEVHDMTLGAVVARRAFVDLRSARDFRRRFAAHAETMNAETDSERDWQAELDSFH